jgi:hypothetical protein
VDVVPEARVDRVVRVDPAAIVAPVDAGVAADVVLVDRVVRLRVAAAETAKLGPC